MLIASNQVKTPVSPINKSLSGVSLLTEDGELLTQETGDYLMFDSPSYAVTGVNQVKTPFGTITVQTGSPMGLLLALTYSSQITVGSGVKNQVKS